MNENQIKVIENRIASYPGEDWGSIVDRVVNKVLKAETCSEDRAYWGDEFRHLLQTFNFLPNSPCLRNFGANEGSGSACFVLPIEDSRKSIFKTLYHAVEVQAYGGGTGFNFSALRPSGALIKSTNGRSSGVVSFIEIFDKVIGDIIKQGGVRKGASMGILNVNHPDILEFLKAKAIEKRLSNFNLSVGITDSFMKSVAKNDDIPLIHSGKVYGHINSTMLWDTICKGAWENGEPGMIFLDHVNKNNPYERIEATNPCGELPMPPYTSCVLGSINLRKINNTESLNRAIRGAVRFLDNIITVNSYPIPEIEEKTLYYRNIGLGFMGLADFFIKSGIRYGSNESLRSMHALGKYFKNSAIAVSTELGRERGYPQAMADYGIKDKRRNAIVTSIAPTGTLSMLADCSSGCEPHFAYSYEKECMDKTVTIESSIVKESVDPTCLVTAKDVKPDDHVRMQGTIQEYIDAGISKTINMPHDANVDDISYVFRRAWHLGCKGLTVYRDGSRQFEAQVSNDCPECGAKMNKMEGCNTCSNPECGYSACSI